MIPISFSRYPGVAVQALVVVAMILAGYRSIVMAWADLEYRKATPAAIENAARLVPANALYHYTTALAIEQNEPNSPEIEKQFAAAVAANPRYSDALLAWSVEKELEGDKAGAARLLHNAQSTDHLLRPTWALANFYFRQGDTGHFLTEANRCLKIIGRTGLSEGRFDPAPIFDLCWKSGASSTEILNRVMPDDAQILDHYLGYLDSMGHLDAAIETAGKLLPIVPAGDLLFLGPYFSALVANDRMDVAVQTWKSFHARGTVASRGPDPAKGIFITNGDLNSPPSDFGFDWHREFPEAVQFTHSRADHSYRFEFDGGEPEQFPVMNEVLPLPGAKQFRLTVSFRSDFNPEQSGLRWTMKDYRTGQIFPGRATVASGGASPTDELKTLTVDFESARTTDRGQLLLAYAREPGTPRIRGFYELLQVGLTLR